ncbi:Transketolase [Candidatus Hepatincola sp. Pdp]
MLKDFQQLQLLANNIKVLSAEMVEKAESGHPGTPVGAADIIANLFANHINFNPKQGDWINRDRFILSAGHACAMLYSTLHILGYKDFTLDSLKNLRQLHAITSGHPEIDIKSGIECTTGPLGEGIAMGVGMALGESILHAKYPNIINHHTFVFAGDGCLMEGVSFEALSLAGTLTLNKLIVIYDKNNITIDGKLELANTENVTKRMEALGFNVVNLDGYNYKEMQEVFHNAKQSNKPSFIIAHTKIAHLAGSKENTANAHGSPLGQESIQALRNNLKFTEKPFSVSKAVQNFANEVVKTKIENYQTWEKKTLQDSKHQELKNFFSNKLPKAAMEELQELGNNAIKDNKAMATRVCSGKVLEVFTKYLPNLIGGSADLSGSNNTIHKTSQEISAGNYNGNYIHYGVREHAMGAVMNGLACSNFIPYGGTFLVFSDFMRPAIRLSALMNRQVWYVFTHDNISLGADGPTHQPIEHIESLRLIPNVQLLRPCDFIETIESYLIALKTTNKPSILILGRSNVPLLRTNFNIKENLTAKGGYILQDVNNPQLNLVSSGSELHLCVAVAKELAQEGINIKVISMPSLDIFKQQDAKYQAEVLKGHKNIVVLAGNATGWQESLGENTILYDLKTFGASGSPQDVMDYFGFNTQKITKFVKSYL